MASWYSEDYKYRRAISVDNTASGSGTWSISMTIPDDMEDFWDNVQADGDDIVVTSWDGFTPITAANATAVVIDNASGGAFSGGSKLGRIRIDQFTTGVANTTNFVWVYWGNAAATSNSAFGAWSSPSTVTATMAREGSNRVAPRIVTRPEDPGATVPRTSLSKTTQETLYLYWDLRKELNGRDEPYEGSLWYEGIRSCLISAETGGGAAAAVVTATATLMLGRQGGVIRTTHPAGTSGTDYTLKLKLTTSTNRVLERRALLRVYDPVD